MVFVFVSIAWNCIFESCVPLMAVESIDISIAVQVSSLKKRLRMDKSDRMVGDWLARSFLKAMVALIGK